MSVDLDTFLSKVQVIKNLRPTYRQPGDGSDGTCDCIGLVIGAIRRSGGKWPGIHGTNYAIRNEVEDISEVTSVSVLHVGDVVFKYYDSTAGLPSRYKPGGSYYNGDLRDYYHVGVVTSVNPLNITHMSTTIKVDTRLGQWKIRGWLKRVSKPNSSKEDKPLGGIEVMTSLYGMKVSTPNKGTLNMRSSTNPNSKLICTIPNGTVLPIYDDSASTGMYKTSYNNQIGYVNKDFLVKVGDSSSKTTGIFIPLPEDVIDTVLSALKKAVSQ